MLAAAHGSSGPSSSRSRSVLPRTNSITMASTPFSLQVSYTLTIAGWDSRATAMAS
jgi:hypothetical protein